MQSLTKQVRSLTSHLLRLAPGLFLVIGGCRASVPAHQSSAPTEQSQIRNTDQPPPPMVGGIVALHGWQMVEEFYSPDKSQEVAILRRDGTFMVRSFDWWTGDWATKGNAYWVQGDLLKPTETFDDARKIARDYMAAKWKN